MEGERGTKRGKDGGREGGRGQSINILINRR